MPARDRLQQQERLLQFAADTVAGGTGDPAAGKPEPARERFDFYTVMPEARQGLPPEERSDTPAVLPSQDGAGDIVAYYLQIEGFSSLEVTRAMQDKLAFMRLDSRIQSGEGRDGYHIQLGPYTDLNELEQVQSRLGKRGIKSTRERLP